MRKVRKLTGPGESSAAYTVSSPLESADPDIPILKQAKAEWDAKLQ